jgi:hypothetical protein
VAVADLDGDGTADLVTANHSSSAGAGLPGIDFPSASGSTDRAGSDRTPLALGLGIEHELGPLPAPTMA